MSVDVYLLDQRWVFQERWDPILQRMSKTAPNPLLQVPDNAVKVLVAATEDMEQAVNEVLKALGNNKIGILHIGSHGNPGDVHIGTGLGLENAGLLGKLKPAFDPYKRVIKIFGCGVASDTPLLPAPGLCNVVPRPVCEAGMVGTWSPTVSGTGYQFVKALANVSQAAVQAAIDVGANFVPWFFTFTCRTVWVYPDDEATEKKFTHSGGWFGTDQLVKHNDFCRLTYNGKGHLVSDR
jgi:hypothetical protein